MTKLNKKQQIAKGSINTEKGHWEIRYKNRMVQADYVSKTLNEVVLQLAKTSDIQYFELEEIVFVED